MPGNAAQPSTTRGRGRPRGSKNKAKETKSRSSTNSQSTHDAQSSRMGSSRSSGVQSGSGPSQGPANAPKPPPYGTASDGISVSSGDDDGMVYDESDNGSGDAWESCQDWDLSDWRDMRYIAETLVQRAHVYNDYWTQSQRDRLALAFLACAMAMKPRT
ncbi:hypothetical protein CF326_g3275 [Tilletia indica]|nr:hypothetical protein CF326_g3275 [Tilletia indica]